MVMYLVSKCVSRPFDEWKHQWVVHEVVTETKLSFVIQRLLTTLQRQLTALHIQRKLH